MEARAMAEWRKRHRKSFGCLRLIPPLRSRVCSHSGEVQVAQLIFGFLPRGGEGGRFFYCSSLDVKSCPRSERACCIHSLPLILREFISEGSLMAIVKKSL